MWLVVLQRVPSPADALMPSLPIEASETSAGVVRPAIAGSREPGNQKYLPVLLSTARPATEPSNKTTPIARIQTTARLRREPLSSLGSSMEAFASYASTIAAERGVAEMGRAATSRASAIGAVRVGSGGGATRALPVEG